MMAKVLPSVSRSPSSAVLLITFIAAWGAGALVRWPYWTASAVHDDRVIERTVGMIWVGQQSWAEGLFLPHSGQVFPLGRAIYAAQLWLFGIDHISWRLISHTVHSASAVVLFALLARYFTSAAAAWLAAMLWATVAVGRWDNFLLWTAMGHAPWAVLGILGAMLCVAHMRDSHSRRAALLLGVLLLLVSLIWSITVLLFPVLIAQYVFLERKYVAAERSGWMWGMAFAVPAAAAFAIQALAVYWRGTGNTAPIELSAAGEAIVRAFKMLAIAIGDLTFWSAKSFATDQLDVKIGVAIAMAALLFVAPSRSRWTAIVFFIPAILFLFMVNWTRASVELANVATSGRYYFWPVLAWCVSAGAFFDGLFSRDRRLAWATTIVVLMAHMGHQAYVAQIARDQHDKLWADALGKFRASLEVLDQLEVAARDREITDMPDIPIHVAPLESEVYFLSALAAVTQRAPTLSRMFARINELDKEDVARAQDLLRSISTPTSRQWASALEKFGEDMRAVTQLRALTADMPLSVPNVQLHYGEARPWLSDCIRWGLADPPLEWLFMRESADFTALEGLIIKLPGPLKRTWRRWIARSGGSEFDDGD